MGLLTPDIGGNPLEALEAEDKKQTRPFVLPEVLEAERVIQKELDAAGADQLAQELDRLLPVARRAQLLVELAENVDGEAAVAHQALKTINEITKKTETSKGVTFILPAGSDMKITPEDPS